MTLHRNIVWSRARSQAMTAYMLSHPLWKLQLGAGTNMLDGWFNTDVAPSSEDILFLDSTQRFPFDDGTFQYVFSEHHIEHLSYYEGLFTLKECYRVLEPGGVLRIATPSLEALIGLHTPNPDPLQQRYIRFITDTFFPGTLVYNAAFVINNAFRNWGHQFLYDHATLQGAMGEVGFVDIVPAPPGESAHEQLRGLEKHGQFINDEEINRFETMVLEGRRATQR